MNDAARIAELEREVDRLRSELERHKPPPRVVRVDGPFMAPDLEQTERFLLRESRSWRYSRRKFLRPDEFSGLESRYTSDDTASELFGGCEGNGSAIGLADPADSPSSPGHGLDATSRDPEPLREALIIGPHDDLHLCFSSRCAPLAISDCSDYLNSRAGKCHRDSNCSYGWLQSIDRHRYSSSACRRMGPGFG